MLSSKMMTGNLMRMNKSNSGLKSKAKTNKNRLSKMSQSALELIRATHLPIGSGEIQHASFPMRKPRMMMDRPTSVQIGKKSLGHHGQKTRSIHIFSQITTQKNSIGKTHMTTFNLLKTSFNKIRDLLWTARQRRSSTD